MINFFKSPPEDWVKKQYFAEKHLPKAQKLRYSPSVASDMNFTWQTGFILLLLLTSRLPRANATNSSRATGRSDVVPRQSEIISVPLMTTFIFNACPVNSAPVKQKSPKADFKQLLEKKASGKKLSKRQKKRLRKYQNAPVTKEVKPEVSSEEKLIQDRIVGDATPEHKKAVVDTIMGLRAAHPDTQYMIDTVLTHLPGMQILLAPLADISTAIKELRLGAFYSTPVRCIVVAGNSTAGAILHEFRHAFWHTYQIAHSPNQLTLSPHLWERNLEAQHKLAVEKYFNLGDARIKKILDPKLRDMAELQKVRELFSSAPQHYIPLIREKALIGYETNCDKYPVGQPYKNDKSLTLYSCKVVSNEESRTVLRTAGSQHKQYLHIQTNEPNPLENILGKVLHTIKGLRANYPAAHYLFEREAYLYELLPIPLIEYFYPELMEHTRQLTKNVVVSRTPFPKTRVAINNFSSFKEARLRMVDIEFIKQLWPEEQLKVSTHQADDLWSERKKYYKTLTPILRFIMKLEYEVGEMIHRLMNVYCEEVDHQNVVALFDELTKKYGKVKLDINLTRCLISSFHHVRRFDKVCEYAARLMSDINASFEKLSKDHGLARTVENKKFCQDMIASARCFN